MRLVKAWDARPRAFYSAFLTIAAIIIVVSVGLYSLPTNSTQTIKNPLTTTATSVNTKFQATTTTTTSIVSSICHLNPLNGQCSAPMNYSQFYQLINGQNTMFVNNENSAIKVYVGYNPCLTYNYYLPNNTLVIVYSGAQSSTTYC